MQTKYPIVLVHGIALKEGRFFKAFGRIEKTLREAGYTVYSAKTDGFGTIENNAAQLKREIERIRQAEHADKVNLIAHSKGGLDAKYMMQALSMADSVASLTTLSTPHKGSEVASGIYGLPRIVTRFTAFWINAWYRIFGDEHPDALAVCRQLRRTPDDAPVQEAPDGVFCQSYSATLKRKRDDFLMAVPLAFSRRRGETQTDGLVSVDSAKYAEYRGDCLDESLSHSEMVGYSLKKKKRQKVYDFYLSLCSELAERGF